MTETFRNLKLRLLPNPNGSELPFTKGLSPEEGFVSAIHLASEISNKLPCLISLLLNLILDSFDEIIPRHSHCPEFIRKPCHIIGKFTHKLLLSLESKMTATGKVAVILSPAFPL
mgnify:CR=1 FL=1